MTDVLDRDVVVTTPEEGHGLEPLAEAKHVAGSHLTLTLRDDPVLHANPLACLRVWPSSDVAGRKDARHTRFQIFGDGDAAVQRQARLLGKRGGRPDAHAHHDEI